MFANACLVATLGHALPFHTNGRALARDAVAWVFFTQTSTTTLCCRTRDTRTRSHTRRVTGAAEVRRGACQRPFFADILQALAISAELIRSASRTLVGTTRRTASFGRTDLRSRTIRVDLAGTLNPRAKTLRHTKRWRGIVAHFYPPFDVFSCIVGGWRPCDLSCGGIDGCARRSDICTCRIFRKSPCQGAIRVGIGRRRRVAEILAHKGFFRGRTGDHRRLIGACHGNCPLLRHTSGGRGVVAHFYLDLTRTGLCIRSIGRPCHFACIWINANTRRAAFFRPRQFVVWIGVGGCRFVIVWDAFAPAAWGS